MSEVMLQQTQVATVERYWNRWMERFPTAESLAEADDQDVLAQWQGLGYYRRCRMLVAAARALQGTAMPVTVREWQGLPGVGRYTAGAISSIAQGRPSALVDGNVERVYARLTTDPAQGPALTRNAWAWAERNLDHGRPGDWNQALMELGATVCTPLEPRCAACPLSEVCRASEQGVQTSFPRRLPRASTVQLSHEVWIPLHGDLFGIRHIPKGEWWEGMWEFPRAEATKTGELEKLVGPARMEEAGTIRHTVTRHRISLSVRIAHVQDRSPALCWLTESELRDRAMPSPQRRALALAKRLKSLASSG